MSFPSGPRAHFTSVLLQLTYRAQASVCRWIEPVALLLVSWRGAVTLVAHTPWFETCLGLQRKRIECGEIISLCAIRRDIAVRWCIQLISVVTRTARRI
ncbi:uncharacterized protein C8Q71DRAFT_496918 [Rhodofomes roseus]|uniref:Secreted protein n=1 Tax=Rhodofomes roseus TaxID=34475 RepID=A0ABQ8KLN2_9APHY|nr:uncharacterized protein C8Q71DRAFT_496918 [Rhodofomes roseus]KAH9839116.1 hypothetical protein C8Q71DRAFT_496918 [Rhodofomes roseus]